MADELYPTILHGAFLIPDWADQFMKEYLHFEVRDTDIYIDCFPKCGASWLQQVVYLVVHGLDYVDPQRPTVEERIPFLEYGYPGLDEIKARTGQRLIKTHLSYSLLPPAIQKGKAKMIVLIRNPKDVMVSFYHFVRMNKVISFQQDFTAFFKLFMEDKVFYGPYRKYVEEFWQRRNESNILLLHYEDMKKNLPDHVSTICKFLDCDLTPEVVKEIASRCEFNTMKKDNTCNYSWWDTKGYRNKTEAEFLRKGEVGDWKNYFTAEMSAQVDAMFKPLEEQGLHFTYEL